MKDALKKLLDLLDAIGHEHEELFDTDVRQNMSNAIMDGFVRHRLQFEIPETYGMYSEEANAAVRGAITEYIAAANNRAEELGLKRFHERLNAVQDRTVRSVNGNDYDEFLGHSREDFFDEFGNVIRTQ